MNAILEKPINEKACDKLYDELDQVKDNVKPYANPIINYLIDRCTEDSGLSEDVMQDHKTWKKCFEYVKNKAKKKAVNGCACIEDHVVFEWAEDYYHKDDKAEEEKKAKAEKKRKEKDTANRVLTGLESPDEKEKILKAKEQLKKDKEKPVKKEKTLPEKETPGKQEPKGQQAKANKGQLPGQMDLFSWLNS